VRAVGELAERETESAQRIGDSRAEPRRPVVNGNRRAGFGGSCQRLTCRVVGCIDIAVAIKASARPSGAAGPFVSTLKTKLALVAVFPAASSAVATAETISPLVRPYSSATSRRWRRPWPPGRPRR
jgi:hypothetical protein